MRIPRKAEALKERISATQDAPEQPDPVPTADTKRKAPSRESLRGLDWFAFFLGDIQTGFGPFLAVYLTSEKWTQTDIGLVLSVGSIAALVFQVPGGALIDNVRSERRAAGGAVAAIGASAFIIAALPVFAAVAFARVLHAAGTAVVAPAVAAISLGLVGREGLSPRLGRNARYAAAGNGTAALLLGACGYFWSAQAVFFVTAFFAIPAIAALWRIREAEVDVATAHGGSSEPEASSVPAGLSMLLRKRAFLVFIAIIALFQMANAPLLPLVGSELTTRANQWAVALIAAAIVLPQIIVALFSPTVGRLAKRIGRRPLLLAALGVLPIRAALFALLDGAVPLVAIQMLDGVSAAVLAVLIPLVIADISFGTGHFNLAQGVVGMSIGLAAAISLPAAGYIADTLGRPTAFWWLAATGALGFIVTLTLMPETRPKEEIT
ncbi:MFS transporter [Rhodomicrobium vannielii ATCC 17100]|uniref:MFS transporter n=1 Tax=Rhodomicrobium vannielii TaxID=1069 RepID=UPI00191AB62A|nr:MFS transporter [Rhodomicrobium vannielii ATCC 17100]